MGVRVIGGVACLAVAGLMLAANVGVLSPAPGEPAPSVSQVIGVFLLPLILAIVALKLFQSRAADRGQDARPAKHAEPGAAPDRRGM